MSDLNSQHNRVVWVDIPVVELDRAAKFYQALLNLPIHAQDFNGFKFCVIEHKDGNGGCLVQKPEEVSATAGILVYLNVNQRIRDAVRQTESQGGRVIEPIHSIGPHGYRAIVIDSEGNRVALHSTTDA